MSPNQLTEELSKMSDNDFYYLLKDWFEKRNVEYFRDCAYENGFPTVGAKHYSKGMRLPPGGREEVYDIFEAYDLENPLEENYYGQW